MHLATLPAGANSQDETSTAQMTHSMKEKSARRENEMMWLRFCSTGQSEGQLEGRRVDR